MIFHALSHTRALLFFSDLSRTDSLTGRDVGLTHARDVADREEKREAEREGCWGSGLPPLQLIGLACSVRLTD